MMYYRYRHTSQLVRKTIEGYQFDGLEVTCDGLSHELNVVLTDPTYHGYLLLKLK